jgi:hypothetical protein
MFERATFNASDELTVDLAGRNPLDRLSMKNVRTLSNILTVLSLGVMLQGAALAQDETVLGQKPLKDFNKLKSGDIVFIRSNSGDRADAIEKITKSPLTHCGIVIKEDQGMIVYEGAGHPGQYKEVEEWQRDESPPGKLHLIYVRRYNGSLEGKLEGLRQRAKELHDTPYDNKFAWNNREPSSGKEYIYCSELVWKAFHDAIGADLGDLHALNKYVEEGTAEEKAEAKAAIKKYLGNDYNPEEKVISPADVFNSDKLNPVTDDAPGATASSKDAAPAGQVPTVFMIVMENHPWSTNTDPKHPAIKDNKNAPYINVTLLPMGAHAENQFAHIKNFGNSLPNYIWLECGRMFFNNDDAPSKNNHAPKGTEHLTSLLRKAGIPWKTYQEDIDGTSCPVRSKGRYAVKHNPFVYFDDVRLDEKYCGEHVRRFTELTDDLKSDRVAGYNFITPNLVNDMHDGTVKNGDDWLKIHLSEILQSKAFADGAIVFLTWDESEISGDHPIGMIVLSNKVKSPGYSNMIKYTHSSTLKTLQELFGLKPTLGDTASAEVPDLSDLFQGGTIPAIP